MTGSNTKSRYTALKIEKDIVRGSYAPGDKIPSERVLSETYGVSRSILREAMRHIAALGLVRTEPQSGTYVTDYRKEASLELLAYLMDNNDLLEPDILTDLLDFREILELAAVEKAAERAGTDFVSRLEALLERLEAARGDPKALAERDYDFHSAFVFETGNLVFRILYSACRSVYLFYTEEFYAAPEHAEHTFVQLELLVDAFRRSDGPKAVSALSNALRYGNESVRSSLLEGMRGNEGG